MKCFKCKYYEAGSMSNQCTLLKWENQRTTDDCEYVNDDGTVNEKEFNKYANETGIKQKTSTPSGIKNLQERSCVGYELS